MKRILVLSLIMATFSLAALASIQVIPGNLTSGTSGKSYSTTLYVAGGTSPYTWSLVSGSLPTGLTLNTSGTITGTPTSSGTYSFKATVKDSASKTATAAYTLAIAAPLKLSTSSVSGGTVGTSYSTTLAATGGTSPYTWSLSSGSLPAGLSLSSAGVISGKPTASGSSTFSVTVKDSASASATSSFTLTVASALKLSTSSVSGGTVGTSYSTTLAATGGTSPYKWSLSSGSLPAGLSLSSAGVISGTPTASGSSTFGVTVKDSSSTAQSASATLAIVVAAAASSTPTGTTYYVSTTGSDSAAGSSSAPWKTVTHACSSVAAGATVIVLPGTYTEVPTCAGSGSSGSPITIQAQYPAAKNTSNRSIFSYTGSSVYSYWTISGSYVQIVGFEITGGNASVGIMNKGSHNVMQWNVVHDIGTSVACNSNGGAAIDDGSYTGAYNAMISNVVYNIGQNYASSSNTCNYFHGLYESGQHSLLFNNMVSNTQSIAITTYHAAYNVIIANNLVFNYGNTTSSGSCYGHGIHVDSDYPTYPVNDYTIVANNIVYNGKGCNGIGETSNSGTHNYYINNDSYNNAGSNIAVTNGSIIGEMATDPGFANYLANGLGTYSAASSGSYMVGRGISLATAETYNAGVSGELPGAVPTTDFNGNARATTGSIDIGPY